jgi:hypothetical protein
MSIRACVKQKPAVGQPLNLQTLHPCLLLVLLVVVVLISLAGNNFTKKPK